MANKLIVFLPLLVGCVTAFAPEFARIKHISAPFTAGTEKRYFFLTEDGQVWLKGRMLEGKGMMADPGFKFEGATYPEQQEEDDSSYLGLQLLDFGTDGTVVKIDASYRSMCVLFDNGKMKCIGMQRYIGSGNEKDFGLVPRERGDNLPYIDLGKDVRVADMCLGTVHTCALLDNRKDVKCFGSGYGLGVNEEATEGYGLDFTIGNAEGEMGDNLPNVELNMDEEKEIKKIKCGRGRTCVIFEDRTMKCWGNNGSGQLVTGDSVLLSSEPGRMDNLRYSIASDIKDVGMYYDTTFVLFMNNTVMAFGDIGNLSNEKGDHVDIGNEGTPLEFSKDQNNYLVYEDGRARPLIVSTSGVRYESPDFFNLGVKVKQLLHRGVLTAEGLVKFEDPIDYQTPSAFADEDTPYLYIQEHWRQVKQVAAFGHTCAILDNNKLKCFGSNTHSQLGFGATATGKYGTEVGHMADNLPCALHGVSVKQVATGQEHTCVILENDQLTCVGSDEFGQIALNGTTWDGGCPQGELPVIDFGDDLKAIQVTAGAQHTCVLLSNEKVKCFGRNDARQLGYDDSIPHTRQTPVKDLPYVNFTEPVRSVSAGYHHTCVILATEKLKCFGRNEEAQLGYGLDFSYSSVEELPDVDFKRGATDEDTHVKLVEAGEIHTCALLANREVRCFGNDKDLVGNNDPTNPTKSVKVTRVYPFEYDDWYTAGDRPSPTVTSLCVGARHFCVLMEYRMQCFGDNTYSQLGKVGKPDQEEEDPSNLAWHYPEPRDVRAISCGAHHTCYVLRIGGAMKCIGRNQYGQLGVGDSKSRIDVSSFINLGTATCDSDASLKNVNLQPSCKVTEIENCDTGYVRVDGKCVLEEAGDDADADDDTLEVALISSFAAVGGLLALVGVWKLVQRKKEEDVSLIILQNVDRSTPPSYNPKYTSGPRSILGTSSFTKGQTSIVEYNPKFGLEVA